MKKVIKKILQSSFGFVMGAIVFAIIGVKATPSFVLSSEEVEYDNTLSGAAATTVRQALDYLDNKADTLLAEQNNNNETYTAYAVGDPVEINGVGYHVIAASGTDQDYVTLLIDEPINDYEEETVYGYDSDYDTSTIKTIVDVWASDNFNIKEELKEVDGYTSRLIIIDELSQFYPSCDYENDGFCEVESTTPSWLYNSNYWYWTMSQLDSTYVWSVYRDGDLNQDSDSYGAVRPVINVYKSKLS